MKKLTSVLLAGMLTVSGCACAITASATNDSTKANLLVTDFNGNYSTETKSYEANVGDIIECTVTGTSTVDGLTGFAGIDVATFFNQESATKDGVVYSDIDMLGYSTEYYDGGAFFQAGSFPGSLLVTRPEESKEFDRDSFGFITGGATNTGSFTPSQEIVKFTLKVNNAGTSYINTVVNEVIYIVGNDVTDNNNALRTTTTVKVVKSEQPTDAPTEAPTEAPTAAPTDAPTAAPTEAPTAGPTDAPTEAPTEQPTEAPTFDPTAQHTYTVVGSDALFDPSWDPTAEKYNLTLNTATGLYELVVPVSEDQRDADVDYKVAADHTWDFSFNNTGLATGLDSNAHLYIEENAVAVKFTFNPETLCANAECLTELPTEPSAPTEAPTTAPTVAPTDGPTDAPTTAPTDVPTSAPTAAPTTSTVAPTSATNAPTSVATNAPTSATSAGGNNGSGSSTSTTTGKVATGDSTSVAILLGVLMLAGAAVVVFRKKITH